MCECLVYDPMSRQFKPMDMNKFQYKSCVSKCTPVPKKEILMKSSKSTFPVKKESPSVLCKNICVRPPSVCRKFTKINPVGKVQLRATRIGDHCETKKAFSKDSIKCSNVLSKGNCRKIYGPVCKRYYKIDSKENTLNNRPCHHITDPNRHLLTGENLNLCRKNEGKVCLEERTPPGIQFASSSATNLPDPLLPVCKSGKCCNKIYVQPPMRQSYRPQVKREAAEAPMTCDTIYKKSYNCMDAEAAKNSRLAPLKKQSQLQIPKGTFKCDTTNALSYQPNWCHEKVQPIIPFSPSLLGKGPLQCETTQKHDFIPKFMHRREKLIPSGNLKILDGNLKCDTVHKLSYIPPGSDYQRPEPFIPESAYEKHNGELASDTTYKMSYTPVRPPSKEDMPWAKKAVYCPPQVPLQCDTITKMSFKLPGYYIDAKNQCCCQINDFEAPKAGM